MAVLANERDLDPRRNPAPLAVTVVKQLRASQVIELVISAHHLLENFNRTEVLICFACSEIYQRRIFIMLCYRRTVHEVFRLLPRTLEESSPSKKTFFLLSLASDVFAVGSIKSRFE